MHAEFMKGERNEFDLRVMGPYACISRGENPEYAFVKYKLTEQEYQSNIEKVLLP